MILAEIKDNSTLVGYELVPNREKVSKFKEEQLSDTFKLHRSCCKTENDQLNKGHFGVKSVNSLNLADGGFHVLEMYPYVESNVQLYETIWDEIVAGKHDKKEIVTFAQKVSLFEKKKILSSIQRYMLLAEYKMNENGIYTNDYVLEINARLHYLFLLLLEEPHAYAAAKKAKAFDSLNTEDEDKILENFTFNSKPVFTSEMRVLTSFPAVGQDLKERYEDIVNDSQELLARVKRLEKSATK